jgi:hypothetical protein
MKRHRKLIFRQPELTSLARASGFNEAVVNTILNVWENIVDENKIRDSSIFNVDKNSHADVQRPEKITAQKCKHQVGAI